MPSKITQELDGIQLCCDPFWEIVWMDYLMDWAHGDDGDGGS